MDCRDLEHICAGSELHCGKNKKLLAKAMEQWNKIYKIFKDLVVQLLSLPSEAFESYNANPLLIVCWCHHGKHRSVAVATALLWIFYHEGWHLRSRDVHRVMQREWNRMSCGKVRCPDGSCDWAICTRTDDALHTAWTIWVDAK